MTVKASPALRNHMLGIGNLAQIFKGGKMVFYTGTPPSAAEDAATGTALVTITDDAGSHTAEVLATGTVSVTGTSGNVTAVTVNGIDILEGTVAYTTDATATAALLAAAINRAQSFPKYRASSALAVVTITAPRGSGATPNTHVVATAGTLTTTTANMASGVSAVNGLKFEAPDEASIAKKNSQTWSGTIANSGSAGYWRLYAAVADSGAADASEVYPRLQGTLATTGGDINVSSTSLVAAALQGIDRFSITMPA
jgi:hypothetical protein